MTRMLCSYLVLIMTASIIGGCSFTSTDSNGAAAEELDKSSVSATDDLLDSEDEMLAESEDLLADTEGVTDDSFGLDDEFEAAELEDGYTDEFEEELDLGFSSTNDEQVDQQLANDELDEFNDDFAVDDSFADNSTTEEFVQDAQPMDEEFAAVDPVVDEPAPNQPIIDVPAESPSAAVSGNQVTNLQYKAFENGGTVVIETQSPAQYEKIVDTDLNQIIIQVNDVTLPERFKRPYVTKDFKQDIATINAYADASGAARFVIQLKRPMDPLVQQEGASILVMTSSGDSMMAEASVAPQEGSLGEEDGQMAMSQPSESDLDASFGGVDKSGASMNQSAFTGEKINLEFIDTDVREIIKVIAERSGVNLIMDQDVKGSTSIRLREVPWDQALLVILRSQGLGYVKQGNVLRIAQQSKLSQEAEAVSKQIKSEKEAKLLSGGIKVKYLPVSYGKVSELALKLKDFTSKEGKIAFDDRTSSLVITDYGEYIARISELVKALDTAPMQVEIESKLVEAREDFLREAGINWDFTGADFPIGAQTGNARPSFNTNLPSQGFSLDLDVGVFDIFGDLSASLSMFESDNKIKVLSQPRIVTMNKVEAEIEQVTQVPIRQVVINPGAPAVENFTFQDLVLGLKVTPQITFNGDVILDVELKREFAGSLNTDGSRELNKRRAKSTVMVKNGKTVVIGGIYQMDEGDLEDGIPWLKDIPLLGYLFKKTRVEKIKNELLLFLKPKILKKIDGPMVSKSAVPNNSFESYEDLTVDEGGFDESLEGLDSLQDDDFDDSFDDAEFEDDGGSLSL